MQMRWRGLERCLYIIRKVIAFYNNKTRCEFFNPN